MKKYRFIILLLAFILTTEVMFNNFFLDVELMTLSLEMEGEEKSEYNLDIEEKKIAHKMTSTPKLVELSKLSLKDITHYENPFPAQLDVPPEN